MEGKKSVIITIVVLLIINTILSIIGILFRDNRNPLEENSTHTFSYQGYLWFYNSADEFLSKYECMTNICDYAVPTIDDDTYDINYYNLGTMQRLSLLNDKYTFIMDGANIYLYDATTGSTLQTYKTVKNYNTLINGNYYIIQNTKDLWGVLMVGDILSQAIPFEYDFIGLPSHLLEDNTLESDYFIVKKDNKWYLINKDNSAISSYFDGVIIDVTPNYIFTSLDNLIHIYSYDGYEYISNTVINDYVMLDDYIGIITSSSILVYKDLGMSYIKSVSLDDANAKVSLEKNDTNINILVNGNVVETIAEN